MTDIPSTPTYPTEWRESAQNPAYETRYDEHGIFCSRPKPQPEPIPVDEQAILALTRVTTGAYIHDTNQLLSVYSHYCRKGNQEKAERFKRMMYERAIAIERGTIHY